MQKINYDAIVKNAECIKEIIGRAKLCAVVKNDAYGHDLVSVTRHLLEIADYFAVGSVDEAEQIRHLTKNIIILLPQDYRCTLQALRENYILTVDSFSTLQTVIDATDYLKRSARIHIKVNSGMSRLGFDEQEINKLIDIIRFHAKIDVQGVYSHFWGESNRDCDRQLTIFNRCSDMFEKMLNRKLIKHIANTSATFLSAKYHLDMTRVGLGLYGYGDKRLRSAKQVTARVIAVRNVNKGDIVGYGGKYICENDRRVAVLDVGYAQGLSRTLVGGKALVSNVLRPIIAICMAMSMIDVTDLSVNVGDRVILVGDGVNISNDNVIIYELLCKLS